MDNSVKVIAQQLKSYTTSENSLAFSYNVKYTTAISVSNFILGIYPREIKTNIHEDLYSNVHGSFVYISTNEENKNKDKKQMSINGWINSNTSAKWNTTKQQKVMNLDDTITWMNLKNNELSKWNYIKGVYTEFHSHKLKKKKRQI